ncbi:hypothetical protein [Mucilaginibacter celer]|uniref:Uncharacterized protein n=1 Tax=Mucilaginibacter celer TaxID=2305508 RepID=A0A494W1D5_9SPHI|nr:hypothetical protein [Mucilaginibacter celer]AYL97358.1 hypothetical protein HYN43_019485 [Mucilaginibacter celer]
MEFGWKYIWKLYGWKELLSKDNKLFYFTVLIVVLTLAFILGVNQANLAYNLINRIIDIGIAIIPTLLGFNLGAYALIIGYLSNKNLLDALIEKQGNDSTNYLEKISGVFAINIIMQAFTLLVCFLIKMVITIIDSIAISQDLQNFFYSNLYTSIINDLIFMIVTFLTVYSIVLVIQNVINLFNFNQLFTYFSLKKKDNQI